MRGGEDAKTPDGRSRSGGEPVYRILEALAGAIMTVQGVRRRYDGLENVPASGGAVLAVNHTSYVDFLPAGLGLYRRGRRGRFLIKSEVMDVGIMRFLVKHARAVPVDRSAGREAYRVAVADLRAGEIIVVYPESTLSRSFELKEFKTGAVRMASEAGVPVIPTIVWGSQRQWTKGAKRRMGRSRIPVDVAFGEPLHVTPRDDPEEATRRLRAAMEALLHRVQSGYPDAPAGADWLPARLGGGAPTPAEALVIEDAEAAEKARRRAQRAARKRAG
ncbi:lysophospholipid acyltransferase family protein [Gordonia shandongensis]|uniref:lysophospholipid acyltransferase family protein n=1 Tax=Gordonia shandongensis TaxID=376351 RepID=UPI000425F385|nr:lysophospholipid acyltransferase family protein [Gordonia shandongensis]